MPSPLHIRQVSGSAWEFASCTVECREGVGLDLESGDSASAAETCGRLCSEAMGPNVRSSSMLSRGIQGTRPWKERGVNYCMFIGYCIASVAKIDARRVVVSRACPGL